MLAFPSLNSQPVYYAWTERLHADPTIVTMAEQGCIISRLRATVAYKRWAVQYRGVSTADKLTIEAFQNDVGVGADKFTYDCPSDGITYTVRLSDPVEFRPEQAANDLWQVDFSIYGEQSVGAGATEYYSELAVLIPQLGAGNDVTGRPVFACPNPGTVKSVGVLYTGASAGIDDDNTAVVTIKNGAGDTIATKTYDTANQPPESGYDPLDSNLDEAFAAGEVWTVTITQGVTADLPELYIITTFYVEA
jgi:hypothetical protein